MTNEASASAFAARILHIDDDERLVRSVGRLLRSNGYSAVEACTDPTQAVETVRRFEPDLVLLDLVMPGISGQDVLRALDKERRDLGIVILTAEYDARAAVECMRLGARDFLQKPIRGEELLSAVARVIDECALAYEAASLRSQFFSTELRNPAAFEEIVTRDEKMLRVFAYLEAVAKGSQPLLLRGETGTGKELAARALHRASGRSGDFVAVNVAGLDDELFSDTLFGHVKGAFTGAERDREGQLERARGGTLLLDEIGDLSEASQVKLLRVLQEKEYLPVGSDEPRSLDARIVAATHRPADSLREDLYFRLRAYQVELPPLRERLGDLPLLVEIFLEAACEDLGRPKPTVPAELFIDLSNASFPGNVRELRAVVFDAVARHTEGVMPIGLFTEQLPKRSGSGESDRALRRTTFPHPMPSLAQIENEAVQEALRRTENNRSAAARMLDVSRPKILRHVAKASEAD